MTPQELKRIRLDADLSQAEMGRRIGFKGNRQSLATSVYKLEAGICKITFERAYKANQLKEQGK